MSAGGLSYSGITTYGKTTLPSVETWGTNMNILRDPPKSIHTRRIEKVGEISNITATIDESHDRACEAILQYARGVNPMVSVSYSNNSNNGGKSTLQRSQGGQAFLPYRVVRDGAFRPPVLRQEQLLPLSRQPRNWTNAFTKLGFTDYSKKMKQCGTAEETREVHDSILKVSARPTAVFTVETPIEEPYNVKYVIQNPHKVSANSGLKTLDYTTTNVKKPSNKIIDENMHVYANVNMSDNKYTNTSSKNTDPYLQNNLNVFANANVSDNTKFFNNNQLETGRYLQDAVTTDAYSKMSSNKQITPIDEIFDMSGIKIQEKLNLPYNTQFKGAGEKNNYSHELKKLNKVLPNHVANTNKGQNIHKTTRHENEIKFDRNMPIAAALSNKTNGRRGADDVMSRDYKLIPKINAGGFDGRGNRPLQSTSRQLKNLENSRKYNMNKSISEQFQRY